MERQYPPYITYIFVALMSVAVLAMQVTLQFIVKHLGGSYRAVGLLIMCGSFWYVLTGLTLGKMSHHFGPRRVMLSTLAVSATTIALMSQVTAMWHLYLLVTLSFMAICLYWSATEHATTGLHSHLSVAQSTAIFGLTFSIGNGIGTLVSGHAQKLGLMAPIYFSAVMMLVVMALVWMLVSPKAGYPHSSEDTVKSFPDESRAHIRRLLIGTRTGLVAVYGAYALVTFFLPLYLVNRFGYPKSLAGNLASLMFVATATTFAVHGLTRSWIHKLHTVRVGPFVAATGMLVIGAAGSAWVVALGVVTVGVAASTVYMHNLCYSLEEPGLRARNAGIHEALVGIAFMLPPALSGLSADLTKAPQSIFWVGAALAAVIGIGQNIALAMYGKRKCSSAQVPQYPSA